jgi:hypothetical protein
MDITERPVMGVKDWVRIKRTDLEKKWRAEMKQLGRETVRDRYIHRLPVTDSMPYPEADFVRKWLDWQDLKAKFRPTIVVLLTSCSP